MSLMPLDTVLETFAFAVRSTGVKTVPGSLEITDGTVNVYFSNADAKPADATEMTVDQGGPYGGVVEIIQAAKWVLIETATGTPVTNQFRVTA